MTPLPGFTEHLVIGGEPAGSMVALRLAESRHSVLLLEREPGAHRLAFELNVDVEAAQNASRGLLQPQRAPL